MKSLTILSAVEQVAGHLRSELLSGSLSGTLKGVRPLAEELGVNHKTVRAALKLLEDEGLLMDQGRGVKRRILLQAEHTVPSLRVAILIHTPLHEADGHYLNELYHLLTEAGHTPFFTSKGLTELGMDLKRIAHMVKQTPADAWVVTAGSREVLAWFIEQETPVLAMFGRHAIFPIAAVGPDKAHAYGTATRRLIELGHRRISLMCFRQQRLPKPGRATLAFLAELERAGIDIGDFNLPDWEDNKEGFVAKLDSMFRHTPPTALILDEMILYHAALHFLAERGLRVPEDVSLICTDDDQSFSWCQPSVAHISWGYRPVIRHIVRWTNGVARGVNDRRKILTKAKFIDGGTVGRAPNTT